MFCRWSIFEIMLLCIGKHSQVEVLISKMMHNHSSLWKLSTRQECTVVWCLCMCGGAGAATPQSAADVFAGALQCRAAGWQGTSWSGSPLLPHKGIFNSRDVSLLYGGFMERVSLRFNTMLNPLVPLIHSHLERFSFAYILELDCVKIKYKLYRS